MAVFRHVSSFESMNAERRSTQEDSHFVIGKFGDQQPHDSLIALFDGHGGRGCVDFVSKALPTNLKHIMKKREAKEDVERSLRAAFLLTDIHTKKYVTDTSGSTGAVCLLRRGEKPGCIKVYAANCGDSRAVLAVDGKPLRLTQDHKAEDPAEQARISQAGGFVHGGRTLGVLAVSRSFGDHAFKDFVPADPYTAAYEVDTSRSEFLVLCCDGVWDVMSDEEAVKMVASASGEEDEKTIAKRIVDEAAKRGSNDNLTAIVVFF